MNFKIDTERRQITLLEEVKWSELARFMKTFIEPQNRGEWTITQEIQVIKEDLTPWRTPDQPTIQPYRNPFWWDSLPSITSTVPVSEEYKDGGSVFVWNAPERSFAFKSKEPVLMGIKENLRC